MKFAFFELEGWETEYLKKRFGKTFDASYSTEHLDETNSDNYKDVEGIGVFIYSQINKKILDKLPNLRFITTMSTGFDHIDITECKKRNIQVSNVPFYGENTVAEHTFSLILSLSRKIPQSVERTKKEDFSYDGLRGFDLKGKTLGVIGTGHIGRHVIRMAKGFEMKILALDAFPDIKAAKKMGFEYAKNLKELLQNSDIITLHAPYNKKTHHLINSKNIKSIKKGALLVNTARGGLIETKALLEGLNRGILSGVGLDVLEEEIMVKEEKQLLSKNFSKKKLKTALEDHILIHDDRVIITPHNAFNSEEALKRILDTTVENIEGFANKKTVDLVS
ncbi:hydroxyacid dehydrogenase [bacterium (Candidatus Howlettbacteria) CG_4_10_14_0_8_um_filter_40_9]|nr:MAG: hydroxyacid dehydrogenase [bacterium (Candidatus Howlettbacteria) CG_4_10_14_0_8_um_filter_40_9]